MNRSADGANIIEIRQLHKSFGPINAVDGISFSVKKGELFAFLGVNGAGKSTTINMLCGQLPKDSGDIIIDGKPIEDTLTEVKGKIGVVFQHSVLDKALSVKDNLESRAALYGIYGAEFKKRLDELCRHHGEGFSAPAERRKESHYLRPFQGQCNSHLRHGCQP